MSKYATQVNNFLLRIKKFDKTQDALKDLYDVTSAHLKVVAMVYLKNKSYACDVIVEAYQKAYKYIDSFDEHQDGYNWLCKITQRIAYSYNKKYNNTVCLDELNVQSYDFEDIDENIDLSIALNSLDKESKKIIIMYFYMGFTFEEIGNKIGKGKASVYKQVQRILKRLKKIL